MKNDKSSKVQFIGATAVALLAFVLIIRAMNEHPEVKKVTPRPYPKVDFGVLLQEAAVPGKQIHVKQGGGADSKYVCKPDDAAIALFTMHFAGSLSIMNVAVKSATDPSGKAYSVGITPLGYGVYMATLQCGFGHVPSSVTAKIYDEMGPDGVEEFPITFTKISPSKRHLPKLSEKELALNERHARASYDFLSGRLVVTGLDKLPKDELDIFSILDTTYGTPRWFLGRSSYGQDVDEVSVRVGRLRQTTSETTLVYRNAKIVQVNGKPFLSLPEEQIVGAVGGNQLTLVNLVPQATGETRGANAESHQEIRLKWKNPMNAVDQLELVDISPDVELMGLDSLHVHLKTAFVDDALKYTARASHHPDKPKLTSIPELKLRIRYTMNRLLSSKTLILPVHHDIAGEARARKLVPNSQLVVQPFPGGGTGYVRPK